MPKEYSRTERIADLIQKELTIILQKEIADPRLRFITINSVKVTKDLAFADILFTQLHLESSEGEKYKESSVKLLKKAAARLRYVLAKRIKLRAIPLLRFFYDDTDLQNRRLHDLIDRTIMKDELKKRHN